MKKMVFSVAACVVLLVGAVVAFECHKDVVAAGLFMLAIVPSALFEEGRKELKGE